MGAGHQFWVLCHRWAGLTLALFLAVAGFSGTFLAWKDEFEAVVAPELFVAAPPSPGARPLDPLAIRGRVLAAFSGARIDYVSLVIEPGRTMLFTLSRTDPATGAWRPWTSAWDELYVDPYTGAVRGHRRWGDVSQGRVNLVPFVYRLHYSLALGEWGRFAFGLAALLWTVDCFVGFALTLPVRHGKRAAADRWWRRWRPSWTIRGGGSRYKLTFDLHRAGGLWVWPVLLLFAWSAVSFNLPQVYDPAMRLFGSEHGSEQAAGASKIALLPGPQLVPAIPFEAARTRGADLAAREMARRGLGAGPAVALSYDMSTGSYSYNFRSSRDFTDRGGLSAVRFGANDGRLLTVTVPPAGGAPGTVTNWIAALHRAEVFGTAWRIFVSLMGLVVTILSVTGVLIWMKKRAGRRNRQTRRASTAR